MAATKSIFYSPPLPKRPHLIKKRRRAVVPNVAYKKRDKVLLRMGFVSYQHYLKSALWKAIRAAAFATTEKCEICQNSKPQHVHHLSYNLSTLRGKARHKLVLVCTSCHHRVEFYADGGKRGFGSSYKKTRDLLRKAGRWGLHTRRGQQAIQDAAQGSSDITLPEVTESPHVEPGGITKPGHNCNAPAAVLEGPTLCDSLGASIR